MHVLLPALQALYAYRATLFSERWAIEPWRREELLKRALRSISNYEIVVSELRTPEVIGALSHGDELMD
jgi:hypothetical protein